MKVRKRVGEVITGILESVVTSNFAFYRICVIGLMPVLCEWYAVRYVLGVDLTEP